MCMYKALSKDAHYYFNASFQTLSGLVMPVPYYLLVFNKANAQDWGQAKCFRPSPNL